jgi:NAD(P)-dependent dehydrogenase (short-subunit alcohol dehydrogenase family)
LCDFRDYNTDGLSRYYVSKLIQLLLVREFANQLSQSTKPGTIITSVVNPGFVATEIMRHSGSVFQVYLKVLQKMLSRTPEEGSQTLVHAAYGGEETHGQYLDDCKVARYVSLAAEIEEE